MDHIFDLELSELIASLAMVVSFCILVAFDRKVWMIGDALITTGFGIAILIFPAAIMNHELDGEPGELHYKIFRLYGVILMCNNIFFYLTRETRDGTVPISIMTAKVFSSAVISLSQVYTYFLKPRSSKGLNWNDQFVFFGMLSTLCWLFGNLIHLMKSHDFSTYPQYNVRINTHLRIDAFIVGLGALYFFAFPDAAVHTVFDAGKLDKIHLHLSRLIGIQFLSSALISMQAGGFLHEHDKRHQFVTRILTPVCLCALLAYFEFQSGVFSKDRWAKIALLNSIPTINAVLGYFSEGTMFYRTSNKED